MPQFRRHLVAASVALVLGAEPVAAQSVEPAGVLPFRRGQWGTEFGVSSNFPSVGFLKFRSDRSAWLVDLSGNYAGYTDDFESPFGSLPDRDYTQYDVTLAAGMRRYRPVVDRVAGFATLGLQTSRFSSSESEPDQPDEDFNGWDAGVFGELGGAWMVTRHLGLGASYQANVVYFTLKQETEGQGSVERSGFAVGAGQTRLLLTLYF